MARAGASSRGYGAAWRKARAGHLANHPHCVWCAAEGKRVKAEHVHHAEPHRGDQRKFWDRSKWVSLCAAHHNSQAQQIERNTYHSAVDSSGLPLDPHHPFNR